MVQPEEAERVTKFVFRRDAKLALVGNKEDKICVYIWLFQLVGGTSFDEGRIIQSTSSQTDETTLCTRREGETPVN